MTDQNNEPGLEPREQAWLDATPVGEARTITHRVGFCEAAYTIDRRLRHSAEATASSGPHTIVVRDLESDGYISMPASHGTDHDGDAALIGPEESERLRAGGGTVTPLTLEELLMTGSTTPSPDMPITTLADDAVAGQLPHIKEALFNAWSLRWEALARARSTPSHGGPAFG
jgi:hypothetical protein